MQICSFRESVTKARGPPAPKLLSKTAGCTAGKIVGAPRRAGPQGHRSVSGEFALSRGVSHPISLPRNPPGKSAPPRRAANSQLGLNRLLVPKRVRARLCELPLCLARGEAANEPHHDPVVLQALHLVPATGRPL